MSAASEQTGLLAQTQRIVDSRLLNYSYANELVSGRVPVSDRASRLRYAKAARDQLTDRSDGYGTLLTNEDLLGDHRDDCSAGLSSEPGGSRGSSA